MSTFDLEQTGTIQRRAQVRPSGSDSDASSVIGLQRLAGNSAVSSAIRSGQLGSDHGQLDLQRLEDDEVDSAEDEYEDEEAEAALSELAESGTAEDEGAEEEDEEGI